MSVSHLNSFQSSHSFKETFVAQLVAHTHTFCPHLVTIQRNACSLCCCLSKRTLSQPSVRSAQRRLTHWSSAESANYVAFSCYRTEFSKLYLLWAQVCFSFTFSPLNDLSWTCTHCIFSCVLLWLVNDSTLVCLCFGFKVNIMLDNYRVYILLWFSTAFFMKHLIWDRPGARFPKPWCQGAYLETCENEAYDKTETWGFHSERASTILAP